MSCAIYFNCRDLVTHYGTQKASRIASSYVKNVIAEMESPRFGEKAVERAILANDGVTVADTDVYGVILVFTYSTTKASETAATLILQWILEQNVKLSMQLPILGIVHSRTYQVLTSECAANVFRLALSFKPTILCLDDSTFPRMCKIPRMLSLSDEPSLGYIVCSRRTVWYVTCTDTELRSVNRDTIVRLAEQQLSKFSPIVLYSYDGGNMLCDSEFVTYLKYLLLLSHRTKCAVISSDIRELSPKISKGYATKIIARNLVSYSTSKKVTFEDKAKKRNPYIQRDELFT